MPRPPRLIQLLQSAQRRLLLRITQEQSLQANTGAAAISPAQAGLLFLLAKTDGATMGSLAQALDLVPSAISGLVQRMESQGWVQRRACAQDARTQRVWLQAAGQAQIPHIRSALARINADLSAGFSTAELATVARWLRHVQQLSAPTSSHACPPT